MRKSPSRHRPNPMLAVVLMVAVAVVLAVLVYSMVGGCAYTGPSLRLTYRDRDLSIPDVAAAIDGWNRSTRVTSNASYRAAVQFDFTCPDRAGHGWVDVTPVGGGPNSTANVFTYANSEHARGYGWLDDPFGPSVDEVFERDRSHVGPCLKEL